MLLHWYNSFNIFNGEKSVGGHVKKSITKYNCTTMVRTNYVII